MYYEDRSAITFERWKEIGREIVLAHNASQWALGDWILSALGEYGERYTVAVSVTGFSRTYCQALATVAAAFPRSMRVGLLWSHYHRAISAPNGPAGHLLIHRDGILHKAREEHWTVDMVIMETQRLNRIEGSNDHLPKRMSRIRKPAKNLRRVKCPHCGTEFPVVGHIVERPLSAGSVAAL